MAKTLRKLLEERVGFEDCKFRIPNVFLPPRYLKISKGRNMVLILDRDSVVHIQWEGSLADPYEALTPGSVRRLMADVFRNQKKYLKDLRTFGHFINQNAEEPFWNPRKDSLNKECEEKDVVLEESENEEIIAVLDSQTDQIIQGKVSELATMVDGDLIEFNW